MTARPLVSIVVPAFNCATTIGETLATIRSQSYGSFEAIVVDDGSTDETAAVAVRAFRNDARFRLLSSENQGPAAARNRALTEANGDLIAPIDADDLWRADYLERQLDVLRSAPPDAGFAYALHRTVDASGQVISDFPDFGCSGAVFLQHLLVNFVGNGSAAIFRREAVEEVGGYDVRSREWGGAEDYLLQLQIAERRPVVANPAYLVGYRKRPDSLSANPTVAHRARLAAFDVALDGRSKAGSLRRWVIADASLATAALLVKGRRPLGAVPFLAAAGLADPRLTLSDLGQRLANRVVSRSTGRSRVFGQPFLEVPSAAEPVRRPSALLAARLRSLAERDRARLPLRAAI